MLGPTTKGIGILLIYAFKTWHSEEFNPEVDIFTVPLQYSSATYTAIIRQASDVTAC